VVEEKIHVVVLAACGLIIGLARQGRVRRPVLDQCALRCEQGWFVLGRAARGHVSAHPDAVLLTVRRFVQRTRTPLYQ